MPASNEPFWWLLAVVALLAVLFAALLASRRIGQKTRERRARRLRDEDVVADRDDG